MPSHLNLQEVGEVTKRSVNYDAIKVYLNELADDVYDRQIKKLRSEEAIREFQKVLILMVVDNKWTDHIDALDQLRNAVGLRGYAQNNPIVEYQSEGFKMFQDMIGAIEYDVTRTMMKAQIHEQSRENVNERVSTTATGNIQAHQVMLMVKKLTLVKLVVMTSVHVALVRNLKIVTVVNNFRKNR